MKTRSARVGRRQILGGAAAVALAGGLGACKPSSGEKLRWDRETDFAVLGSGTGTVGALAARAAGLEVTVLEKRAIPGGNTGISGGVAWVPNNSLMRAAGIADSRAGALRYLRHNAMGQADEELLEAFVDNGPQMADFVQAQTPVRWRLSKIMGAVSDYHPEWDGSVMRGRSIEPDVDGVYLLGGHLMSGLLQGLERMQIPLLLETPARRLITRRTREDTLEVIGVRAMRNGREFNVRTRRGVLLSTGGFEHNAELKRHFLRGPSLYTYGTPGNTGDGLRMAMLAGADLRNLNELWAITVYKAEGERARAGGEAMSLNGQVEKRSPGCIAVNRYGMRFCNEAGPYDTSWSVYTVRENSGLLEYRNLPAFHIFDYKVRRDATIAGRSVQQPLPDWVQRADSLPELARILGIDAANLQNTVRQFNRYARQGRDPLFHRGIGNYDRRANPAVRSTLAPVEEPPFFGAEVAPADSGTCGGPRVNRHAQVLDPFGEVIERLYASGNCSGVGAPGTGYAGGGGTIGPAMSFAYIAGRHASALRPWS